MKQYVAGETSLPAVGLKNDVLHFICETANWDYGVTGIPPPEFPKLRPKPARLSSTLLMSGEGKRGRCRMAQATAPFLDSTIP
jgi:hypothetical protein